MKSCNPKKVCELEIRNQTHHVIPLPFGHEAIDRLAELQRATFGGEALPGDSAEFIRESRVVRSNQ